MDSNYDIVRASQSKPIVLIVGLGDEQEEVSVPKELVSRTSNWLANLINRDEGKPISSLLNQYRALIGTNTYL